MLEALLEATWEATSEVKMAFRKGRSANPDGRSVEAKMKRAARAEGYGCVLALAKVRDDSTAAPEVRAHAAAQLLALAKWNGRDAASPALGQAARAMAHQPNGGN